MACRLNDGPQMTQNFFLPFQCQCDNIGECRFKKRKRDDQNLAAQYESWKEQLKTGMDKQIEMFTTVQVQPNPHKQMEFTSRVQSWMKLTGQYEDELTQAIALSVIPEDI